MDWTDRNGAASAFGPRCGALLALAATALLGACTAAGPRESPLPKDGKTVVEVYRDHIRTEGSGAEDPRDRLKADRVDDRASAQGARLMDVGAQAAETNPVALHSLTYRDAIEPMNQRFARLPNPDLVMYVHPHLSKGGHPVPGYLTVFPMYERVEYAMPGEVSPTRSQLDRQPKVAAQTVAAGVQRGEGSLTGKVDPISNGARPAALMAAEPGLAATTRPTHLEERLAR